MVDVDKRVLIMDDDEVVRRSYERVLSGAGYRVRSARSGPDAIEEARRNRVDVVLADLRMPGMDGMTAIRHLRERQPDMRVVVITGYPSPESSAEAERLGIQAYLTKPVAPDALTRVTEGALAETVATPAPVDTPAVVAPKPEEVTETHGLLKSLALLSIVPFIGLAYVILLPFLGTATLLGLAVGKLFGAGHARAVA